MRPRRGGRWGQVGQSGRGRFGGGVRFRIGMFEFGIGLRGLLPTIVLVGVGAPRTRTPPRHPLHQSFVGPVPVIVAPEVLAATGPFGPFGGVIVWRLLEKDRLKRERERMLREIKENEERQRLMIELENDHRRFREQWAAEDLAKKILGENKAREALRRSEQIPKGYEMEPEFPPFFDYPQPVPLIARPARIRPALPKVDVAIPTLPEILPARPALVPLTYPIPIQLPGPEIAPTRPTVAPVELPVRFPSTEPFRSPYSPFMPLPQPQAPRVRPGLPFKSPPIALPLTPIQQPGVPSSFLSPGHSFADPSQSPCICPPKAGPSAQQRAATKETQRKKRKKCYTRQRVACTTRAKL
jgi:hypothetical protein